MLTDKERTYFDKISVLERNLEFTMIKVADLEKQLKKHESTVGLHSKEI